METNEAGFNPENLTQEQKEETARSIKEKIIILARNGDILSFHERLVDKAEELKAKYPDYDDYELYHLLISSTVYGCAKFDFPGEDSVEKFIDSEFEKQQSERADNRPE